MNYKFTAHNEVCVRISEKSLQSEQYDRLVDLFSLFETSGLFDWLFKDESEIDLADYFESIAVEKRKVMRLLSLSIAYLARAYRAVVVNHCNVFVRDRKLLAAHYHVYINSEEENHLLGSVCSNMNEDVIIEEFWRVGSNGDRTLKKDELGWPKELIGEAQSDHPETIFRHIIEVVGFNLLFFWTKDQNFYSIETEKDPIEVRRIAVNPEWDGHCMFLKAGSGNGPCTSSPSEVIATYEDPTTIWDELELEGVPIGQVIDESLIVTWD